MTPGMRASGKAVSAAHDPARRVNKKDGRKAVRAALKKTATHDSSKS